MKDINQRKPHKTTKQLAYLLPIVVGAGIFFLGTGIILLTTAFAAPVILQTDNLSNSREESVEPKQDDRLPFAIVKAIREDLSEQTEITPQKIEVIEASRQTWSDGCLGLAKPNEFCTFALVEGWRVIVSDGTQNWVYRTDEQGNSIRLESKARQGN
ncbi:MAG: hypothetical protein QNJ54_29720 [Prochloraceae cyanobacterium]|nr:hypothetical protein [Prochloraceae cyanobacterium]